MGGFSTRVATPIDVKSVRASHGWTGHQYHPNSQHYQSNSNTGQRIDDSPPES